MYRGDRGVYAMLSASSSKLAQQNQRRGTDDDDSLMVVAKTQVCSTRPIIHLISNARWTDIHAIATNSRCTTTNIELHAKMSKWKCWQTEDIQSQAEHNKQQKQRKYGTEINTKVTHIGSHSQTPWTYLSHPWNAGDDCLDQDSETELILQLARHHCHSCGTMELKNRHTL